MLLDHYRPSTEWTLGRCIPDPVVVGGIPLLCYAFRGPSTPANLTIFGAFSSPARPAFAVRKAQLIFQPSDNNFRRSSWMEVLFFFVENFEKIKKKKLKIPDGKGTWIWRMALKITEVAMMAMFGVTIFNLDSESTFSGRFTKTCISVPGLDATYKMMQIFAASRLFVSLSLSLFGVFCTALVASCIFQDMIGHGKEHLMFWNWFFPLFHHAKQSSRREI